MNKVRTKLYGLLVMTLLITVISMWGERKEAYATMSSLTINPSDISASSEFDVVTNLLDLDYYTRWISADISTDFDGTYYNITTDWFRIDLGARYVIDEYDLEPYVSTGYCGATDFTFYGSDVANADGNNAADWTLIDTVSGNSSPSVQRVSGSNFTDTTAYRYYKVQITKAEGTAQADISRFYFYGTEYTGPSISSVDIPSDGSYTWGDTLDFTVNYNETVTVVGIPVIPITLDVGGTGYAYYIDGSGSTSLKFQYSVSPVQEDSSGISLSSSIELLSGASITGSGSVNLNFTPPDTSGIKVDNTAPVISGVSNGVTYNTTKAPTYNEGTATLEKAGVSGTPSFTSGASISDDGDYTLTVTDAAGLVTTVSFTIDKTAPAVGGVTNNAFYNSNVAATFTEGDATLKKDSGSAVPYTSGAAIAAEGSYILVVTDTAGNANTVTFTIDTTAPVVSVVSDGGLYKVTVSPTFTEGTATLEKDGGSALSYTSGTAIASEGSYVLVVTDAAGNVTTISFTIDKTPPAVGGVTNNAAYKVSKAPTFTEGTATLAKDGGVANSYTSGTAISADGSYVLVVTDTAGNANTVTFTIDTTVPVVSAVSNGGLYTVTVSPSFTEGTATLSQDEGSPSAYSSEAPIAAEGSYVLIVTDAAGNVTTVNFTIDKTAPAVGGVTNNAAYNSDVAATFTEGTATLKKDSGSAAPYTLGTAISADGSYVLVVTDTAGNANTITFTIDKTAPTVSVVSDGGLYKVTVSPTFNEGTATLEKDGGSALSYTSGTAIAAEGSYILTVTDAAGNVTTVNFTIDKSAPAVGGVTNNAFYNSNVAATFTEGTATLAKDGGSPATYTSGTAISADGSYVLVVTDTAGNANTVTFTIDKTAPTVSVVSDGGLYKVTVSPTYNEGTATLKKDSGSAVPYTSGTAIASEGSYVLTVTDAAANTTTVSFIIDKTAVAVTGVNDGTYDTNNVTPGFTEGTATLSRNHGSAVSFTSGTEISAEGEYVLVVTDAAGNQTTVNFILDKTKPTGTLVINRGESSTYSKNMELTLTADDGEGSGVDKMRFSLDNQTWGEWKTYSATDTYTGSNLTYGQVTIYVQFKDKAGYISDVVSDNIDYVNTPTSTTGISNQGAVTKFTADVKQGQTDTTAAQITIERRTGTDGTKSDTVTYDSDKAKDTIKTLKESGEEVARIVIPDTKDEVSETTVNIPAASVGTLADGDITLQIDTQEAKIDLPKESLMESSKKLKEDLYFKIVPIKEEEKKAEVEHRVVTQVSVLNGSTQSDISVIGVPMVIETNMPSSSVDITLPLTGITVPADAAAREEFLSKLAVYIDHSDGTKEMVKGEIVEYATGVLGIKFHINKFSTFTVVKTDLLKASKKDILKVIVPEDASIIETSITANVSNAAAAITPDFEVSDKASWELYLDKKCTNKIKDNLISLTVGKNIVYVKVTAEDGSYQRYKMIITRANATPIKVVNGFNPLRLQAEAGATSQDLSFTKVSDADGYVIYGAPCGTDNSMKKLADLTADANSYKVTGLKEGTYYKYLVKAYKEISGKKVVIAVSEVIHSSTTGRSYANPTSITANVTSVSLNVGATEAVTCELVLPKGKTSKAHVDKIRYVSTDKAIADINSSGTITAKAKGSCYIYAYAQNGICTKIKVTVK